MKSKKITALLLASAMVFSLASCSIPGGKRDRDDDDERIERTEDEETEKTTEKTTEETTSEETTEETTTTTESETEATEAKREEFSGKVVDFDDMHFYVKGKKYTLGKSTLQEMIDDGVPFEESDLKKVDQKIKKNQRQLTGGFRIRLDKFWSALVYVMNVEDDEKTLAESVSTGSAFPASTRIIRTRRILLSISLSTSQWTSLSRMPVSLQKATRSIMTMTTTTQIRSLTSRSQRNSLGQRHSTSISRTMFLTR